MILFIYRSKTYGSRAAETFNRIGIPSRVTSPESAHTVVSNRYRAIIFSVPSDELFIYGKEYVISLKTYSLGAPVFAICAPDETDTYTSLGCFDAVFSKDEYPARILRYIQKYQRENGLALLGSYMLAGIDASISNERVTYFGDTLRLTANEKLILRTLIRIYPNPIKAKDILKYAFRASRLPEVSTVRAHICGINKKYFALTGRKLIEMSEDSDGYVVQTPLVIAAKSKRETFV